MPGSHRQRVSATVDSHVASAVDLEHFKRQKVANDAGSKAPDFSHTVEDILKIGLQTIQHENTARSNKLSHKSTL